MINFGQSQCRQRNTHAGRTLRAGKRPERSNNDLFELGRPVWCAFRLRGVQLPHLGPSPWKLRPVTLSSPLSGAPPDAKPLGWGVVLAATRASVRADDHGCNATREPGLAMTRVRMAGSTLFIRLADIVRSSWHLNFNSEQAHSEEAIRFVFSRSHQRG